MECDGECKQGIVGALCHVVRNDSNIIMCLRVGLFQKTFDG